MNTVKIGTFVYVYDERRGKQKPTTATEHLHKWLQYTIVAETRASWVAQYKDVTRTAFKLDKKTLQCRDKRKIEWSTANIAAKWEDTQFCLNHARAIADLVYNSRGETLKQIADIVGYTAHKVLR